MPLLYSGSGRYSGGNGRCEPLCTKVIKPPPPPTIGEDITSTETPRHSTILPQDDPVPKSIEAAPVSKKRKFSFKHGKMSVKETPLVNPDNIYLEVQGKEIEVSESCLLSNSQHFTRVLEDISSNSKSEYLMDEETEDEEEEYEYEEDDEEDVDDTFSSVSYESVSTVIDFIAKRISDLELSEVNVSQVQHVARLLGINTVEKITKKFVRTGLSLSNCFSRFSLADSFLGWSETSSLIQTFIEFHFSEILTSNLQDFCLKLNEIQLKRIIASSNLHIRSEDEVMEAVLAWVRHDPEARGKCLAPLMDEVQVECLSGAEKVRKLLDTDLLAADPHCVEILEQGLEYHELSAEDKVKHWREKERPSRWPQLLVCLSYAEKVLECYDWCTGQWSVLTEKPDWVFGAELAAADGRLFTLGGVASSPEPDTWGDGSWPSLRRMRLSHGCCVAPSQHGGVIITGGGSAEVGGAGHRDVESVEPGLPSECDCALCGPTDHIKWETLPNMMASTRTFGAMASIQVAGESVVMVVGGDQDPDTTVSSVEILNRKRGTWSSAPNTLSRRDCCRLAVIDDYVYAIGGYDNVNSKALNSCERFSFRSGKWEEAGKMRVARRSPGVVSYRGVIYSVGGMGAKKDLRSMEMLDPVTRKWVTLPASMISLSGWISATLIDKPVRMM